MSLKRKLQFRPLLRFAPCAAIGAEMDYFKDVMRSHPRIRALPRAKRRKELRRLARMGLTHFSSVRYVRDGKVVSYLHMS